MIPIIPTCYYYMHACIYIYIYTFFLLAFVLIGSINFIPLVHVFFTKDFCGVSFTDGAEQSNKNSSSI